MERRNDAGVSLVEVVVCLLILAAVVVPIMNMVIASRRASSSAGRIVDVSLHAQLLLEALSHVDPRDLPPIEPDTDVLLLDDRIPATADGGPAFRALVDVFRRPPPVPMQRRVAAQRLPAGELALRVDVTWLAVVGEERTRQHASFRTLTVPWSWAR